MLTQRIKHERKKRKRKYEYVHKPSRNRSEFVPLGLLAHIMCCDAIKEDTITTQIT
jgi:hypothetical protein